MKKQDENFKTPRHNDSQANLHYDVESKKWSFDLVSTKYMLTITIATIFNTTIMILGNEYLLIY